MQEATKILFTHVFGMPRFFQNPEDLESHRPKEEARFLCAFLYRAFWDLVRTKSNRRSPDSHTDWSRDAYAWFLSNKRNVKDYLTFLDVCDYLGLNPKKLRNFAHYLYTNQKVPPTMTQTGSNRFSLKKLPERSGNSPKRKNLSF